MEFQPLESDAVVSYTGPAKLVQSQTFTVGELAEVLRDNKSFPFRAWYEDGVPCKVLRPGHGWQKGRLRVKAVEFCPDESVTIDE